MPEAFQDLAAASEAAALCRSCPLVNGCLAEAFRYDAAYRRGADPYGITGCCGGVWFSPGEQPRSLSSSTHPRPRRVA